MGCARLPRMPSSRYRALTIYNVFFEQNKMAEGDTRNTATGDFVDGWKLLLFSHRIICFPRKRGISVVSALASGARGPRFDPRSRRGKFRCLNTLSLVSFAGMTLNKCAVLWIGTLTGCPLCRESHPSCKLKNPTVIQIWLLIGFHPATRSVQTPDPGIFVRGGGGPGQSDKKSSDNGFFFCVFFFIVLSLFYRSQMVNFKEIYHCSRFQRGSNIFQGGGVQFFPGRVQLLIPYRNPYNLWFSRGGGVRTPCPPLWILRTCR